MSDVKVYCDGGLTCGCYVIEVSGIPEDPVLVDYEKSVTNNEAEYLSILFALSALTNRGFKGVEMFTDSLLVVTQITHEAVCRAKNLIPLRDSLQARLDNAGYSLAWLPREENPAGHVLEGG